MTSSKSLRTIALLTVSLAVVLFAGSAAAQAPPPSNSNTLPSEMPTRLEPVTDSFDYTRREVMIPMRDGIKLHTVILIPKGAKNAPILLTRTPYNATELTNHSYSSHLGPSLKRLRQRPRSDPRRRLHPRRPGHSRQTRLRRRLRHQSPVARPAESHPRRSFDRHL